jgi:hypothetical protein
VVPLMADSQYAPLSGIPLPPSSSSDKLDTISSYENEPAPSYFEKSVCSLCLLFVCCFYCLFAVFRVNSLLYLRLFVV